MRLKEAIASYIAYRQALGVRFKHGIRELGNLADHCGNGTLKEIDPRKVATFLERSHTARSYRRRHDLIRAFFDHCLSREGLPPLVMPLNRPVERRSYIPHIYTPSEMRALLKGISNPKFRFRVISRIGLRSFLVFLYSTGAFPHEVLALRKQDVDLKYGFVTFHTTKYGRARKIPICRDLRRLLIRYTRHDKERSQYFFHKVGGGEKIVLVSIYEMFKRLLLLTGVKRETSGTGGHTILDLRSTFAVHRITAWMKRSSDLNRMLPALAAYMGLSDLSSTERFLKLTPERFRKTVAKLSPNRSRKRWRDDPELMQFLRAL